MLTGTPLDLTPFGSLLSGMGTAYWAVAFLCAGLAAWFIREWPAKVAAALVILGGFALPVVLQVKKQGQEYDAAKAKLDESMALFQERCKSAGEKIHRAVDGVDGVVWMKWRDKAEPSDDSDQFKLFDPYGRDCTEQGCIEQLLRLDTKTGRFEREVELRKGRYRFVEAVDPTDGKRYRYTGTMKLPSPPWTPEAIERQERLDGKQVGDSSYRFALESKPIEAFSVRYGIAWDDISTRDDREHWIAGGSIKVIDLQTNEVLAEQVGFLIDPGQGGTAGFRSPWGWARSYSKACPPLTSDHNIKFVVKVLRPNKHAE